MGEKYRGEFGSSPTPTLLDDTLASPELLARWEESIPELTSRPPSEPRYFGDLCKIGGTIHVWKNGAWHSIDEENRKRWLGC